MIRDRELPIDAEMRIPVGSEFVHANLVMPLKARGIVLFAHGSGSSRHSPRNVMVARSLQQSGMGTLLLDLLTPSEEQRDVQTREHRFDIALLSGRLEQATCWLRAQSTFGDYRVGYFGASTGSAAALVAAARLGDDVRAVVSRGGRPDLAGKALGSVTAATLLIVGSRDPEVLDLNRDAFEHLRCTKEIAVVPGATHLFEEPGALEHVSDRAADWFERQFA